MTDDEAMNLVQSVSLTGDAAMALIQSMSYAEALRQAPELAMRLGHPTTGAFAAWLWTRLSGGPGVADSDAARIYLECGYKPFEGYPLARVARQRP